MKRKAKSAAARRRDGRWFVALGVALAVLLLLLRLIAFLAHARRHV